MRIFEKLPLSLVIPLVAIMIIVTLPITLPIAAAQNARSRRRLLADAWGARCSICGEPFGKAALDRADDVWGAQMAKLREAHPHSMLRIVRRLYADCVKCGTEYGYDEDARGFRVLEHDTGMQQIIPAPA